MHKNANVIFESNNAVFGGAVCLNNNTNTICKDNSTILFKNNMAISDGGAVSISINSSITIADSTLVNFTDNNAQYGGAIFFDITYTMLEFNNDEADINFNSNTARIAGDHMYFDSDISGQGCLKNRISSDKIKYYISTPPNKLELLAPALCISYDSKTEECDKYYQNRLMLGEEINIPVCLLDYCNPALYSAPFRIFLENNQNYFITGSEHMLLSCNDTFNGISIGGYGRLSKSSNLTINITLNDD